MTDPAAVNLIPHPEGGRFREIHRSENRVTDRQGRGKSALTHIYFALAAGEVSRFHRVEQEEVWNLYRGALRLWMLDPETRALTAVELSAGVNTFCAVVPPGHWQAAEPLQADALAGCTVAPGFDFSDFELITPEHPLCGTLRNAGLDHLI